METMYQVFWNCFDATPLEISRHLRAYSKDYSQDPGYYIVLEPGYEQTLVMGHINEYDEVTKKKVSKEVDFLGVMHLVPHEDFDKPVTIHCYTTREAYEDFWIGFELSLKGKFLSVDEELCSEDETIVGDEPWNQIPDHLWDRTAVQMWREGYTSKEIALSVGVTPRRVTNRLSELRQRYPHIVLTNDMRREMLIRQTRDGM